MNNAKVLIVDSNYETARTIKTIVAECGVLVLSADSPAEALSLALRNELALMILNISEVKSPAASFESLLNNNQNTSHVPLILICSSLDDPINMDCLGVSIDYLAAPINQHHLKNKVQIFLESYKQKKTSELLLDELRNAQKELSESRQEFENFASVVSHDLKEPLRKVIFYSQRLLADNASAFTNEIASRIQSILSASDRMQKFLGDLLEFSRANTKKATFDLIDLDAEVRNVVLDLDARIQETNGIVDVKDLPKIYADPTQMRQLFQNLIANSLKYHREGVPPKITVRGYIPDDDYVEITVTDNGLGFDKDDLEKMFLPFERLSNSHNIEGTGVGLATVHRIVDRHKGRITALSRPNKGSVFVVTLPQQYTATLDDSVDGDDDPIGIEMSHNLDYDTPRVLVAEDRPKYQAEFSTTLQELGYAFDIVEHGQDALDLFKMRRYDIILMDCDMPVLDGFAATVRIREWEAQKKMSRTPIIASSLTVMFEDEELYKDAGMDGYMSKPFSMMDLNAVLTTWVKK